MTASVCSGSREYVERSERTAFRQGTCPVCGRSIATRWNGRLYRHNGFLAPAITQVAVQYEGDIEAAITAAVKRAADSVWGSAT